MVKQWKNEDIIYPEDAQRWEDGLEDAKQNNSQNATNLKSHTDNKSNPHGVTAAQTGAYTKAEADSKDAAVLTSAKSYTDLHSVKKDNPHGVTAGQTGAYTKAEADERDASTLSAAKSYSDTKKTEATIYTDQRVAAVKSEIQSGSVASANKLATARKIAGIDFDGTKDISIPANNVGAYTKTETDSKIATTRSDIVGGNVASATKLLTARTINGASFDGTSNIVVTADPDQKIIPNNTNLDILDTPGFYTSYSDGQAGTMSNTPFGSSTFTLQVETGLNNTRIVQTAKRPLNGDVAIRYKTESTSWSNWVSLAKNNGTMQSGLFAQTASKLNAARTLSLTGAVTGAAAFDGSTNVAISTSITGNAPTASKLQTARTISLSGSASGSVSFDGSGNVILPVAITGNAPTATSAAKLSTARTISLTGGATGSASFDGSGNVSIATTLAGNAPSATKLATARTIAGVSFDGTSNIAIAAGNVGAYTKAEVDAKIVDVQSPSWVDVSKYLSSSFRLYSGSEGSKIKVQVANKGTLIISGIVSPTKVLNFPNNTQEYDLVSIPKSVLSVSGSWSICPIIEQASGAQVWLLGMEDNGTNLIFKMSRHRYGTSWTNCNAGDWLPFTGIVRLG